MLSRTLLNTWWRWRRYSPRFSAFILCWWFVWKHAAAPSCSLYKSVWAERWLAKPHLLSSRRFEVMGLFPGGSYWLRTLSYRAVILQPAPLFLPRRECFAVLFSWFLFYLHVAAPALCQSWQSRLKWARPFSRIPANHGAPLGLLRRSWPIKTPWRITDRLRVRVTDGRTISFKI